MRRVVAALLVSVLGCSSGALGDDEGESDTQADASPAETTATGDDTAVSEDTAPVCGVIACDEDKTHYPRIRAAYDRVGGEATVGAPFDNGGGVYVHAWGAGRVQDFANKITLAESDSSEAWAKTGYAVRGALRDAWLAAGGGPGLGYPKEDEHAGPGGRVQIFEKGCLGPDGSGAYDVFAACEEPPDLAPTLASIASKASTSTPGTDVGIAVVWLPTG
jgi:hypothetical protein